MPLHAAFTKTCCYDFRCKSMPCTQPRAYGAACRLRFVGLFLCKSEGPLNKGLR